MGAVISKDGDEWDETFPNVISGHIHDHQKPQKNIYYPGAPLQHAFGDTETRVVCYIDENRNIVDIPLDVPKKRLLSTTLSKLDVSSLSNSDKSTFKIKLLATPEEFKLFKQTTDYKMCIEKGIKIQLNEISMTQTTLSTRPFKILLNDLVSKDNDPLLKKLYSEINLFNNK